ncbi:endoribonuclease L-PSP [Diaporthe helianthi]|uniref:Endoribonuclease L-PSP n=1 Tax=Diaporthe helianthi TaxID=158607 RepID=A0A2P5HFC5_DIAHE|nr:endoribonuclease L-PSP [Diaporthe helianthi]
MSSTRSGWPAWAGTLKDVYAVKLYHTTDVNEEAVAYYVDNMRKYMPDHRPILCGLGVASLAFGMKVEIEVRAHIPQGS